jgi:putative copper resistance protein D
MAQLTAVLAYLDVILRGAILAAQALAVGGVVFAGAVLLPAARREPAVRAFLPPAIRWSGWAALGMALGQCLSLFILTTAVGDGQSLPAWEVLATGYGRASALQVLGCLLLFGSCRAQARVPEARSRWIATLASGAIVAAAAGAASHATSRLEGRTLMVAVDALHQLAADAWIGGLVHLLATIRRARVALPALVIQRFSPLAMSAVAALVLTGLAISWEYVGGAAALYGTSYGTMLATKVAVFGGLLALGGTNYLSARLLWPGAPAPQRVGWFLEAEVGLGVTVLFIAASLTSLPPAADVPAADRATLAELGAQFTPQWPRLTTPGRRDVSVDDDPLSVRSAEDIAWSEYNHHVAGLLVLAIGTLTLLEHTGRAHWARHWPLLFVGLAAFLLVRDDPEAWPFGPLSLWKSLGYRTILQHYFFVILVLAFAVFEWLVRTGRLRSPRPAYVFPLLAAVGATLLLAHSHSLDNLKTVYLVEITHLPLGVLGCCVGWARWLELRLAPPDSRRMGWAWSAALVLIGFLLLLYRES